MSWWLFNRRSRLTPRAIVPRNHTRDPGPPFTPTIPDIPLNLDPGNSNGPFQVRIDLADELWNLGQLPTSRALMEEVAHEASGETQARALQWLAERG